MRVLASQTLILWDQTQTILSASKNGFEVDDYVFPSMRRNAQRLEESLQVAIGMGLWSVVVGDRPHVVTMFSAFSQSLVDASVQASEEAWTKEHYLMGIVRLLDVCSQSDLVSDDGLQREIAASRPDELVDDAWTYLQKPA